MARLSIRLLGSLQVTLEDLPVTDFESDKVRALLAYLAVEHDQPHRRERLAGLLWPELPEEAARANLRVALSNLRKTIGDSPETPFLNITRKTIQLHPEGDVWIDLWAFSQLLATSGRPGKTVERLRQAVALYRGGFLHDFSLAGSAGFEAWTLLERERLQRQAVEALRRLARWHEARGEQRQALPYAQRLVDLEPWQEEDQRRLMRLLALTGQRNAALAQYQALQRSLGEELGVEPEDETAALCSRLCAGQGLHDLSPVPPVADLPVPLTPFVGRGADLDCIYQCLQDPACRLLSLVGPGGSGKTRLALEAASDVQACAILSGDGGGRFAPSRVSFVPLAPVPAPDLMVPALADAIGFTFHGQENPRRQLLDYLQSKSMLLVLDNLEHLLAGPDRRESSQLVVDILRAAPGIKILATSRCRIDLGVEQIFPVHGLAHPDGEGLALEALAGYDSVELFLSGAGRARPGFALTAANAGDVLRICRLVEGMPLAILLAAAWIETRPPGRIADEIEGSFDVLERGWQDAPARQRSMRAVFDHSWRLLSEREQQILRALSVFRGGFTPRAARAVTGGLRRELDGLVRHSLLSQASSGRYEIHELLRQFLGEKLDAEPEVQRAAKDRQSAHYTNALQRWGEALKGARQQAAMTELEADAENARAAWNWAVAQKNEAQLDRAVDGLCRFYEWRARFDEGQAACRTAIERLIPAGEPEAGTAGARRLLWARLLVWQGVFEQLLGHIEFARQLLRRGLALLEEMELVGHDTRSERAHALLKMGQATVDSDRLEARRCFEQSLELYRSLDDAWGRASAQTHLGQVMRRLGFYDHRTEQLQKESLALWEELGDRRGMAQSLIYLANLLAFRGRIEESADRYRQAIALHWGMGNTVSAVDAQSDLVYLLVGLGECDGARALAEKNLVACQDLGSKREVAYALSASSFVELHRGEYELARTRAEESLALARQIDFAWGVGISLWYLGCVAMATEQIAEAQQLLDEGIAVLRDLAQWDEFAAARATEAIICLRLDQPQLAEQCLDQVLPIPARTVGFYAPLPALCATALLAAERGHSERAVELYALACKSPLAAASCWFQDVIGRQIAAVAATLAPSAVRAARERGQTLDMSATLTEFLETGTSFR